MDRASRHHQTSETRSDRLAALSGAVKRYGRVTALDGLDLEIRAGETLALLGPNGAGKTTAVKLLLGLASADAGKVRLFGGDPRDHRSRRRVGAMLQVGNVPETLSVREHLELFASYYPSPAPLPETLAQAGLEHLENRPFGKLSGGERQRLLFGLALCGNPELLVLDEPTAGLDVQARRKLWAEVDRFVGTGRSVLLTTHHLEEADALAHRIVVIHRGRVLTEGSPGAIKAHLGGRRIRCVTRTEPSQVKTLPGVTAARWDGPVLEAFAGQAEPVVRALLELDPHLRDLEVTSASLEEAFVALTAAADRAASPDQLPTGLDATARTPTGATP